MDYGWISLHRKIQSNPFWLSEPFTRGQAWVDLLLLANHKDNFIRVRGMRVEVKRGQVGMSQVKLSQRWKWSKGKVIRFLNELEMEQQIEQQKNNVSSLISIVNYNEYQSIGQQTEQQTEQQTGSRQNTNNNDNNENKDIGFEEAWASFGRVGVKKKSLEYWRKLSQDQKDDIMATIPKYLNHLKANSWKVQKNFEGWINPKNQLWTDTQYQEFSKSSSSGHQTAETWKFN
jgi:hypothetical protein